MRPASLVRLLAALAAKLRVAPVASSMARADEEQRARGAVFVETNDISANAIVAYARSADGALTPAGRHATEGRGAT